MYDTIIIGAGPAGMTAGIFAARREMKTLIISKDIGGQLIWASEIANYPGFKLISNTDLIYKMQDQARAFGVEIKNDEVKRITKSIDNSFILKTEKEEFKTKTIIIALGLSPRRLAIPGEEKFTGKGVSYCANCDAPFYKNKIVAVIGGGNSALDAAELLSKIASKVYLIHRRQEFRGFEALVDEIKERENIELILDSIPEEILGNSNVKKIKVSNVKSNKIKEIDINGVFIEIGRIASTDLVADLVKRDEYNQIIVDEKCKTSLEGIFAAGDVTQTAFKQIAIACGQASTAALAAYEYFQLKQGKKVKKILDRSVKKLNI